MNSTPAVGGPRKHPGGRPRVAVEASQVRQLRDEGHSWRHIAKILNTSTATVMRRYDAQRRSLEPCQNSPSGGADERHG